MPDLMSNRTCVKCDCARTLLQYRNLWHPAHFDTFTPSGTYVRVPVDAPSVQTKQFAHVSSNRSVSNAPPMDLLIDATNCPGPKSTFAKRPFPVVSPFSLAQTGDFAGRNGAEELAHPASSSSATLRTCLMGILDRKFERTVCCRKAETRSCFL